ncbi:effector-associated constant component EACC1 [Nocardioides insulae]|uniref:effector-associated constant component EACC1 n=1 Tax=Nocardioides insulae TaxID=394734 RepID=UPI00040591EE|nr:hypothetical protein [Nocardioides insulae]
MDAEVKIELVDAGGDTEATDELVDHLRWELLELDVAAVSPVPATPAPPGSKGVDMAAAAALLVQVRGSVEAVRLVVSAVRAWFSRSRDPGLSVKVTIGDRTLELSRATVEQQERLVQEFLRSPPADAE